MNLSNTSLLKKTLIVVAGPTASGKTDAAIALASFFNTQILSADSRQFYQELNIGTAKPSPKELLAAKHHFVGHISIHQKYDVYAYEKEANTKLEEIFSQNEICIMAGGSGLYIDAVCNGLDNLPDADMEIRTELKKLLEEKGVLALAEKLKIIDPEYYNEVDLNNPNRLIRALEVSLSTGKPFSSFRTGRKQERNFKCIYIGVFRERDELNARINQRTEEMIKTGLLEEVESLIPYRHLNALNTVGYRELFAYFDGNCTKEFAIEKIKTNTRRYAKRQMTWFRRNKEMAWMQIEDMPSYLMNII